MGKSQWTEGGTQAKQSGSLGRNKVLRDSAGWTVRCTTHSKLPGTSPARTHQLSRESAQVTTLVSMAKSQEAFLCPDLETASQPSC